MRKVVVIISLSLPSSKSTFPQPLKIIIIFYISTLWKAKFFKLCDVIFLVRLQGKFEIDHSWEWKGYWQRGDRNNRVAVAKRCVWCSSVRHYVPLRVSEYCIRVLTRRFSVRNANKIQSQSYSKRQAELRRHRGNTLFCRAVTSISSQRLPHKMTNSRAVFRPRIRVR